MQVCALQLTGKSELRGSHLNARDILGSERLDERGQRRNDGPFKVPHAPEVVDDDLAIFRKGVVAGVRISVEPAGAVQRAEIKAKQRLADSVALCLRGRRFQK